MFRKPCNLRKTALRVETLEDRMLLAVSALPADFASAMSASLESGAETVAAVPAKTDAAAATSTKIVISTALPTVTEVDNPVSVSEVNLGDTFYVSVYVKSTDSNYGITCGYCTLYYEDGVTPVAYTPSAIFPNDTQMGYSSAENHYLSAFGGLPVGMTDAYGQTKWALAGTNSFTADKVGEYTFWNGTARKNGVEKPSWNFVREDYTETEDMSVSYDSVNLTVTAQAIKNVVLSGWEGAFDGLAHSITVTDPQAATDTIRYSTDGVNYNLKANPEYTTLGTHTTYVKVSRSGCNDWYGSAKVVINEAGPAVQTKLVISASMPTITETANPVSETSVYAGDTFYVSVYAKSTDSNYGVTGGYCTLYYEEGVTPVKYTASAIFPNDTQMSYSSAENHYLSAFGGKPAGASDAYGKTLWALIGTYSFTADEVGEYTFSNGMARNGSGTEKEDWSFVREDSFRTFNYENTYDTISLTVKDNSAAVATKVTVNTEIPAVSEIAGPESITEVKVGDTFYVSVWVKSGNSDYGIVGGYCSLYFDGNMTSGSYTASPIFSDAVSAAMDDGHITGFGGCPVDIEAAYGTEVWALAGTYSFTATDAGELTFSTNVATKKGAAKPSWNFMLQNGDSTNSYDSITIDSIEELEIPAITTGTNQIYVSYGANRQIIRWNEIDNAAGYELQYSYNGKSWSSVNVLSAEAVVSGLTYGASVQYRVRALAPEHGYADSDWSEIAAFTVCPVDINNDGDIALADRRLLSGSWLSSLGDAEYRYYADIDADGEVALPDRSLLASNWLNEVGVDEIVYPKPKSADFVFADFDVFESAELFDDFN